MIRRLLEFPFILWILIAAALAYRDYKTWEEETKSVLEAEVQSKKGSLSRLQTETARIEDFKRRRAEKLQQLQELAEKFKSTADKLPRQPSIPDLLKSLADLADRAGLEFSRFKPLAQRKDQYPFLTITPLEVTLKGTYVQVMTFLDSAANLTRVVSAEKLTFDNPVARGPVALVNTTASLVTYHIDETEIDGVVSSVSSTSPVPASAKKGGGK